MRLKLADDSAIKKYVSEISRIGNSVNDPGLFYRIEKACLNKQAFLFVSPDGFLVLKTMAGHRLLVWVAHSFRPADRLAYFFEIERLAREISASMITFWSNRKGFLRVAPSYGYTATPSTWMNRPITVWSKTIKRG